MVRTPGASSIATDFQAGSDIVVEQLTKSYARSRVVDVASFRAEAGEFVTLLGPSGCGKTTTLMMIAGLTEPDYGDIRIAGRSVLRLPPHKREIGVVFQHYALFPHMSVFANVAYPLQNRGWNARQINGAVGDVLNLVGLQEHASRYPKELSGGQQQRVATARAIVFKPTVLLLDEPLSALDRKLREQMCVELKALQRTLGVTVICVTHDQEEALSMSDRIIVMDRGRIVQNDKPAVIYKEPATAFVASFVGETNTLDGCILSSDESGVDVDVGRGEIVKVLASSRSSIGRTIRLAIRPERIRFYEGDSAVGQANRFKCHVDQLIFQGQLLSFHVRTEGGRPLLVKRLSSEDRLPSVGEIAWVCWNPADVTVVHYL